MEDISLKSILGAGVALAAIVAFYSLSGEDRSAEAGAGIVSRHEEITKFKPHWEAAVSGYLQTHDLEPKDLAQGLQIPWSRVAGESGHNVLQLGHLAFKALHTDGCMLFDSLQINYSHTPTYPDGDVFTDVKICPSL